MHHSFSKLKRVLTLMIIKQKAFEIGNFYFKTHLNIFVSNRVFDPENHELKKYVFNKSYSFLCYLKHGCIIHK
jgi:hypothetical protein